MLFRLLLCTLLAACELLNLRADDEIDVIASCGEHEVDVCDALMRL
jgi:hypothetical protein